MKLCVICEKVCDGVRYGITACIACGSFYRRAVRENKTFVCLGYRNDGNRCKITTERGACGSCRKRKCYEAGMVIPQLPQKQRSPKLRSRGDMKVPLVVRQRLGDATLFANRGAPTGFWNSEPWVALRVASTAAEVGSTIRQRNLIKQPAVPAWQMETLSLELIRGRVSDLMERPSDWQGSLIPRDFISAADERRLALEHWPVLVMLNLYSLLKKWSISETKMACVELKQVRDVLALVKGMCYSDLEVDFAKALAFLRPGTVGLRQPDRVKIVRENVWMVMKEHCQAPIFSNLLDKSTGNRVQQLLVELSLFDVRVLKSIVLGRDTSANVKTIIEARMKEK